MKITIESTPELIHANGLPVRVWTGTTGRGTPILALVTRIAVPDTASPEDIAAFERELAEPPTRVVDPSGAHVAAPRSCTICNARGQTGKRARFIAESADGLQWFECGDHDASEHAATFDTGRPRTALEPLESWFHRHDLPVPGADPDAYALEIVESPDGSVRCVTNRCRHALVVMRKGADAPEPLPPGASATLGPDDYVALPVAPRHSALEHDRLYEAVVAAAHAFVLSWEDNDAVPDPDELPAERKLYDATVALRAFEIDAKLAAERAEHDEHDEPTLTDTERATLDAGMRVAKNDGEVEAVLQETLATTSPPLPPQVFRASIEARMRMLDDIPAPALHACEASPRIAGAVLQALLSHPEVVEATKDGATRGEFLAFALRGAQLGWHVRHAHPKDVRHVANIGAPMHEPHRSAWLDGYRIGAETLVAPVHLTDAMRSFHDSHLVYRAPETLTARERAIIAAVEAERAAAAGDPEALAAHAFGGQEGGS